MDSKKNVRYLKTIRLSRIIYIKNMPEVSLSFFFCGIQVGDQLLLHRKLESDPVFIRISKSISFKSINTTQKEYKELLKLTI
jgi:hypothetical protein